MGITEGNAQGESRTPTSLRTTDFKFEVRLYETFVMRRKY